MNLTNTKYLVTDKDRSLRLSSALLLGRPNYNLQESQPDVEQSLTTISSSTRAVRSNLDENIPDLPGTELEVEQILQSLKETGVEANVALWNDATEDFIKNNQSKNIIHIATHGFFFEDEGSGNPMINSGLLLAGVKKNNTTGEDGILTAYEASTLNFANTDLVVLSACETGLGKIKNGEGVYGLQRAFEVAGVNYILMSLWKVDDQATKDLMSVFYSNLINTKNVHQSFKDAQLQMREKYEHTNYWGAFKLIGH